MGGKALKNCTTRRYAAQEYFVLEAEVLAKLRADFPGRRIEPIKAYGSKEDFGDMDVILESNGLTVDLLDYAPAAFGSKEIIKNGNVYSFEYQEFQIDVILTPTAEFQTSLNYFCGNDTGNLIGRIAHSMGLKLGHDGLSYAWRDDSHQYAERVLETDWSKILPILDLDYDRWAAGFQTLDDIFQFVSKSRYFSKDIYLLHNRNYASRVRDAKRKTYNAFLTWLEEQPEGSLNSYPKLASKDDWLPYLFEVLPGFEELHRSMVTRHTQFVARKARLNEIVSEAAPDRVKLALGELRLAMKDVVAERRGLKDNFTGKQAFNEWVTQASDEAMREVVQAGLAKCSEREKLANERAQAIEYLQGLPATQTVAELYDEDDELRDALNLLIADFEYPDHSYRKIADVLRIVQVRPAMRPEPEVA